jgi:DNA-binding LacI/PurR family transcriptional regulator
MALSVLSEALERGVAVPESLAIVGHDGIETSMLLFPRVTTIVQPRYEMGVKSAKILLDRIEGNPESVSLTLPPNLFKGSTT